MKFLCMTCDSQMKTVENRRQSGDGALSIVLECPDCFGQVGMLTNPMETQLLDSLDVSVCPVGGKGRVPAERPAAAPAQPAANPEGVEWTAEAEARLQNVPRFARDMVRQSIENLARERGSGTVTTEILDEARELIGS